MVTKCHIIFLTLKFFCQKFFASLYQFSLQPIMLCVSSGIYFVLFRPKPIVAYWVCKNKSVKKNIYLPEKFCAVKILVMLNVITYTHCTVFDIEASSFRFLATSFRQLVSIQCLLNFFMISHTREQL